MGIPHRVKLLLLVGLVVALAIGASMFGRKSKGEGEPEKEGNQSLMAASAEVRDKLRRKFQAGEYITLDDEVDGFDQLRQQLGKSRQTSSKNQAAFKAIEDFYGELCSRTKSYAYAASATKTEMGYNPVDAKSREEIQNRKARYAEMLRLNTNVRELYKGEHALMHVLGEAGVNEYDAKYVVWGLLRRQARMMPFSVKMRESEGRTLRVLLEMCDLLDAEWGNWKPSGTRIVSESTGLVEKYDLMTAKAEQAGKDHESALREMMTIPM